MQPQAFIEKVEFAFFYQGDNETRKEAEKALLQFKDTNTDDFMKYCSQAFANIQFPNQRRIACSTLIKRLVTQIHPSNQVLWLMCSEPTKQLVKNDLMNQLVDQNPEIRRSAANTISEICAIELPRQEWPDLISSLTINTKSNDIQIRTSAIMTLGFICESLKNHQQSGINTQDAKVILMGICFGMDQNEGNLDIKTTALKALKDSLFFMNSLFSDQTIFTYVKNLVLQNAVSNINKIQHEALLCLIDFVKQLFHLSPIYIQELYDSTRNTFENANEIGIAAIEIWNTLCQETKENLIIQSTQIQIQSTLQSQAADVCSKFIQQNYEGFAHPFMKNLLIDNGADDDEQQGLSISESSYKALTYIIEIGGVITHDSVKAFIENTINNAQSWEFRKASMMAIGALAEVSANDTLCNLLTMILPAVFEKLYDPIPKVKRATAQAISRIAENYPKSFHNHDNANQMIQILLSQLNNKLSIVIHIIWVFVHLTESLGQFPQSYLAKEKLTVLQHLASIAVRQDIQEKDAMVIDVAFMGVLNIVYTILDQTLCKQYCSQFVQQLQLMEQQPNGEVKSHIQSGIMSAIHGVLVRMDEHQLSDQEAEQILNLCLGIKDANDKFYVISGLATCMRKRISKYCGTILQQLNEPLKDKDDSDNFKNSLFSLADLTRAMEDDFEPYIPILDYLLDLINSPPFNRESKLHVYNAIADIVLGCKKESFKYITKIKQVLQYGFQASCDLTKSSITSDQDYAERLKETMVGFYTCLLHAFCDIGRGNIELGETIEWFYYFSQQTCDVKLKPTAEFVRMILGCIFDIVNFFKQSSQYFQLLRQFTTSQFVADLIQKLSNFKDEDYKECVKYGKSLLHEIFGFQLGQN